MIYGGVLDKTKAVHCFKHRIRAGNWLSSMPNVTRFTANQRTSLLRAENGALVISLNC
jgi:hypothetical protein